MKQVFRFVGPLAIGISHFLSGCSGPAAAPDRPGTAEVPQHLEVWRETTTGMELVYLERDCFQMGFPDDGKPGRKGATLIHEACVGGIWVGKTEVTRDQFARFVEETQYRTEAEEEGFSWVWTGKDWVERQGVSWRQPGFEQTGLHPVVHVSWHDAQAMASWLSSKGVGSFRLLSEAEWEYACRAGGDPSPPWGGDGGTACLFANVADESAETSFPERETEECDDGHVTTSPSGEFPDNPFGLQDFLGNVWEWGQDRFSEDAYRHHRREDPVYLGGSWITRARFLVLGDDDLPSYRVLRGGSWIYDAGDEDTHCSARRGLRPDYRSWGVGFRLARESPR